MGLLTKYSHLDNNCETNKEHVAQLVEHSLDVRMVTGSNPVVLIEHNTHLIVSKKYI